MLAGAAFVAAYNLELFGGRLHSDLWFAIGWGAFPAFTGYFVNAGEGGAAGPADSGGLPGDERGAATVELAGARAAKAHAAVSGTVTLRDGDQ